MSTEQVKSIRQQIEALRKEYAADYVWGVRFDKAGLKIGHTFKPSRVWVDGKATRRTLPGTCIISADSLGVLNRSNVYLGSAYIVCGERVNGVSGQDAGEEIVSECEVMAVIA